jgi:hypothetical protein
MYLARDRFWSEGGGLNVLMEDFHQFDEYNKDQHRKVEEVQHFFNRLSNIFNITSKNENFPFGERLYINPGLFSLYTLSDETESPEFMIAAWEKAKERESITIPREFRVLLQNDASFVNLNHRTVARAIET